MIKVDVKGLAGVEAALEELAQATSSRTAKAALSRGLVKAAQPMVERAQALAPKRTGRLARSIAAAPATAVRDAGKAAFANALRSGADQATAVAALRGAQRSAKAASAPVTVSVGPRGAPGSYAHLPEFGSVHSRPQPFMRPAYEATKDAFVDGVGEVLKVEIAMASARAKAKAAKLGPKG